MSMVLKKEAQVLKRLLDPVRFAAAFIRAEGEGRLTLDPWQQDFLRDRSKFILLLKSRRVGGSFAMALKMFIRSQMEPSYSGTFISLNLEEAMGKIEYADAMYESLPRRFRKKRVTRSRTELAFEDGSGRRSALRSLASRAPRGKGGDVGISELPHCRNQQEIYEGALHVTSRAPDHRLIIESTPLGRTGVFYDLSQAEDGPFTLYRIPWWHSAALCTDPARAAEEAPKLPTAQRVERFGTPSMRAVHASMPEDVFKRESELEFTEASSAAFPLGLLQENGRPSFGTVPEAELKHLSITEAPSERHWRWLSENVRGIPFAGYDVGRTRDESALTVIDDVQGRQEVRFTMRLRNAEFRLQEKLLMELLRTGVRRVAVDATGIGMPLAEKARQSAGDTVMPVHFTARSKEEMVNTFRIALLDKKISLPLDRSLMAQLSSIQQTITEGGATLYAAPRTGGTHADLAWSLLLACHAARSGAAAPVDYQALTTRRFSFGSPHSRGWKW